MRSRCSAVASLLRSPISPGSTEQRSMPGEVLVVTDKSERPLTVRDQARNRDRCARERDLGPC